MSISEVFKKHHFSGVKRSRYGEAEKEVVLDYSEPNKANVSTSIDCYVSGQYIDGKGNVAEAKFRFAVYVKYSADTVNEAMAGVRQRIEQEFQREFPGFEMTAVIIPKNDFIIPTAKGKMTEDEYFYYGSNMYKLITQMQRARYDMKIHKDIYDANTNVVKKRYGLK